MWKLVVATLALSTACLALPPWRGASLGDFSKIKSLSSFSLGAKELYPGDNTDGEAILHALAAIQDPVTLEKVKNVLKEHAAKLYERVVAAEAAFAKVRDSVGNSEAKALLTQYGAVLEKNLFAVNAINEQAKDGERFLKSFKALNDEASKEFGKKLIEAAEAVEKALYKP